MISRRVASPRVVWRLKTRSEITHDSPQENYKGREREIVKVKHTHPNKTKSKRRENVAVVHVADGLPGSSTEEHL